jgi:hypothetical protein
MKEKTILQYEKITAQCKAIFTKKTTDYGTAWRILRLPSITDQIFIKAKRIRSIQEKGTQLVADNIKEEFIAIINYAAMALIQIDLVGDERLELPIEEVTALFNQKLQTTFELMLQKNHDYGEAWRDMRVSSITDIILMKLLRVKQIEDNQGKTLISENVDANYQDMINYSIFALILMSEKEAFETNN